MEYMESQMQTQVEGSQHLYEQMTTEIKSLRQQLADAQAEVERLSAQIIVSDRSQALPCTQAVYEYVERLRKDAERYRWLRNHDEKLAVCDEDTSFYLEYLDEAIDAAMERSNENT